MAEVGEQFEQRTVPAIFIRLRQLDGQRHDVVVGRRHARHIRSLDDDLARHFEDFLRRHREQDGERRRAPVRGGRLEQQLAAALGVVGGKHHAVDVREQGLGDAFRIILDLVVAPGGGDEGQAVGPRLGRHQQGRQRHFAAVKASQVQGRHLRRDGIEHLHHGQVAVLVGRIGKRLLGVAQRAGQHQLRDLFRQRGKIAFLFIIGHGHLHPGQTSGRNRRWLRLHQSRRRRRHWRPAGRATGRRRPTGADSCAGRP